MGQARHCQKSLPPGAGGARHASVMLTSKIRSSIFSSSNPVSHLGSRFPASPG